MNVVMVQSFHYTHLCHLLFHVPGLPCGIQYSTLFGLIPLRQHLSILLRRCDICLPYTITGLLPTSTVQRDGSFHSSATMAVRGCQNTRRLTMWTPSNARCCFPKTLYKVKVHTRCHAPCMLKSANSIPECHAALASFWSKCNVNEHVYRAPPLPSSLPAACAPSQQGLIIGKPHAASRE